jgi:hypothetical protein
MVTSRMKQIEYMEGSKAVENFEEGMKSLFKVSKDEVAKAEKKAQKKRARASSQRKQQVSDKD